MPSRSAHHAPRFLVLAGGLLLLGAGTASMSTLQEPTLAAAFPASGTFSPIHQPGEALVAMAEATGETTEAGTGVGPDVSGRDNPVALRPGATDPTVFWIAPDGSTGPGVSAIFRVFGKSDGLTWALRVAHCESHYDPGAVNSWSGATGLFQFMPSTWNGYFAGWNIWDPVSQAQAALAFYQRGWINQWECK